MQEVEPLVKKGKEEFERRFNEEIKKHKKDIDLRNALRQFSAYTNNRHEKKIDQ